MARKSKYREEYHLPWIRGLTRRGCTIDEIADDVGVAVSTIKKWLHDYPELSDAVKKARTLPDIKVEDSLYKRAIGFKTTKTKTIVTPGKDESSSTSRIEVQEEEIAPDTVACIFWLKNRDPKRWRDVKDTGNDIDDILLDSLIDNDNE